MRRVGQTDGQTDMTKLIVTFFSILRTRLKISGIKSDKTKATKSGPLNGGSDDGCRMILHSTFVFSSATSGAWLLFYANIILGLVLCLR